MLFRSLEDELVKFKDADVECSANDVFAQVHVKIKNETASAYKKALNFIVKLLRAGFAASYAVKLSSKAQKTYLPIKGLAQTQTHRFFAAALAHGQDYTVNRTLETARLQEENAWLRGQIQGSGTNIVGQMFF